jgi:hypothetical protein
MGILMTEKVSVKVLYIEDEPDLRERIRIVLEMYFTDVIIAQWERGFGVIYTPSSRYSGERHKNTGYGRP